MATKTDLVPWLEEALQAHSGHGTIVELCQEIWQRHEPELRASGDLFYTWQYDVRWAAYKLREAGRMKPDAESPSGIWELSSGNAESTSARTKIRPETTNFDVARRGVELAIAEIQRRGGVAVLETGTRGSNYVTVTSPTHDAARRAYVKTRRTGDWQTDTRKGVPRDAQDSPTEFWLFVDLTPEQPAYFIAPTWWVENDIYKHHQEYLAKHGGRRAINPDATHHRITTFRVQLWRERWDLLLG